MYAALYQGTTPGSIYNFNDLPCPPMSVMWNQWYKPEPGEPYRPRIVFPSKLLDMDPLWKVCTPGLFTGYDPPRTLDQATAMVPKVTPPSHPTPDPRPATPAATQGNLPKRTTTLADPIKTSSDPSLTKSHGGGGMQEDPSRKPAPPRGTKKAPSDPSSNNQGKKDLQEPSSQKGPTSNDPKNGPISHASSNNATNSDLDRPANNVHASVGPSIEDGDTLHQSQTIVSSAPALMTTVLGDHDVLVTVEGKNINGVNVKPGGSATDVSGQQIAVDLSNDPQVGGQTSDIEPVVSLVASAIANRVVTASSKSVTIQEVTLEDEGPARIVAGTTFSIDASGTMFVNGHPYRVHNASPKPTTINGEVVIPLPTGVSIHPATLTSNAPPIVISGISYSLDSSGNLLFGGSSYVSHDLTQVITIAGRPVLELAVGDYMASARPTAGASANRDQSIALTTLDSSNLLVGSVTIPVQKNSISTNIPESISGGLSSQGLGTTNVVTTTGRYNSSSLLAFTGGSEGRKVDFSMMLFLLIGAWTIILLRDS